MSSLRSIAVHAPLLPSNWEKSLWSKGDVDSSTRLACLKVSVVSPVTESPRLLLSATNRIWGSEYRALAMTWSSAVSVAKGGPVPDRVIDGGLGVYNLFWAPRTSLKGAPRLDISPIATVIYVPVINADAMLLANEISASNDALLSLRNIEKHPLAIESYLRYGGAMFHCDPTAEEGLVGTVYTMLSEAEKLRELALSVLGVLD